MAPDFRFSRPSLSSALQWSAVLAFAVIARNCRLITFSPRLFGFVVGLSLVFGVSGFAEAAKPLQLLCQPSTQGEFHWSNTVKFRIDLDKKIIELLDGGGNVMASTTDRKMNALTPTVRITESAIEWNVNNGRVALFRGVIERETGQVITSWRMPEGTYSGTGDGMFFLHGPCQPSRGPIF